MMYLIAHAFEGDRDRCVYRIDERDDLRAYPGAVIRVGSSA